MLSIVLALTLTALLPAAAAASGVRHASVRHDMLVTTEWLAAHLDDADVEVIHVGFDREGYDAGHVPGAHFLAWGEIAVERDGVANELPEVAALVETFAALGLDSADRVVIYDDTQGIPASRAYMTLDSISLAERAALLDGHLAKWRAEGRPLSTEVPRPEPSAIEPRPRPEVVVALSRIEALYGQDATAAPELVDTRPAVSYTGEEPGRAISRGGHIPGAVHVYWKDHLAGSEIPVLRPPAELLELYAAAGVEPGERVITYCRTGAQASHSYFTLKYLGFDVSLYDGSFIEWSAGEERPVASQGER